MQRLSARQREVGAQKLPGTASYLTGRWRVSSWHAGPTPLQHRCPGTVIARTWVSGLGRASARLTSTCPCARSLSPCQARRGQTTLPFSAPGSYWRGEGAGCLAGLRPACVPLGAAGEARTSLMRWSEWAVPCPGQGGQGLEELLAQLPAWAGLRGGAVSGGGQATPRQSRGVSFRKRLSQSHRPPSPKGGAEGGTHTCLSYARNVVPQVRTGGGAFRGRGWGRGLTSRARKTLQVPAELGTGVPGAAGAPGDPGEEEGEVGRGGPGPPPWLLWALQGVRRARDQ